METIRRAFRGRCLYTFFTDDNFARNPAWDEIFDRMTEVRVLEELALMRAALRHSLRISELQAAYVRAKTRMPSIEVPSRLKLFCEQASLLRVSVLRQTRRDLARFWITVRQQFRHGRIGPVLRVDQIALNAFREIRLAAGFLTALMTGRASPEPPK